MEIIVGTAGHIDHGKTALIKALTGVDTDRLPEEKERGITIDIGFAQSQIEDVHFGFVDVPGHERFVKNMLAGVSGIDLVLLVIAADEGVMPQTREHFEICRLLGVGRGLIVLSKLDLVDDETLELARLEVSELVAGSFLEDAPVIPVSAKTGDSIEMLNAALLEAARSVDRPADVHVARLSIDRSFTVKGFGTVVTGTLVSGEITATAEMEIVPDGRKVRVRGLQTHGENTLKVQRGQRVAVNLAALDRGDVERGMTLSEPGVLLPTQIIDARVEVLADSVRSLRSRQRVRVHIGTREALARVSVLNDDGFVAAGTSDFLQLRFEAPLVALPGERFIIRAYSPQTTIAGGCVIDNLSEKHRKKGFLAVRESLMKAETAGDDRAQQLVTYLRRAGKKGSSFPTLQAQTGLKTLILRESLGASVQAGSVVDCGDHFISRSAFDTLIERSVATITNFHRRQPLAVGLGVDELRDSVFAKTPPQVSRAVLAELNTIGTVVIENEKVRLASHKGKLSPNEAAAAAKFRSIYAAAGYEVPRLEDALADVIAVSQLDQQQARTILQHLVDNGELAKVTDEFYFSCGPIDSLVEKVRQLASKSGDPTIDVAKFKEIAGVSRKYAIPLLEYFDSVKVTVRSGDKRIVLS